MTNPLRSPGWQLVAGGVVLAVVFPSRLAGSIGLAIAVGGFGVVVARTWPRLPQWVRAPRPPIGDWIVIGVVAAIGLATFSELLAESPDWPTGDWGPQRAVLAHVIDRMPAIDLPTWNHTVGTGDAPFELYPKLTYLVIGWFAAVSGLRGDLPLAMLIVAIAIHIATAIATGLLAARIAPRPIAAVVGCLALVDSGTAVAHGGPVGLFRWALIHSALALVAATVAAIAVARMLERPRLGTTIMIWVATAMSCIAHPAGLLAALAALIGLAAVALLADDVRPRRALVAMLHIALGVAAGAAVWMPLGERIVAYGQHFPNGVRSASQLLENLLAAPSPATTFAFATYAGYLGIIAGLWSRRAPVVFISAAALALLVGLCDAPYLALDLVPGQGVARLGTERLAAIARPLIAATSAYAIGLIVRHAIESWRGASPVRRSIAAAVIAILFGAAAREVPAVWSSATTRTLATARDYTPDAAGRAQLVEWARERARELRPDAYARALFEVDSHEHFHLTAETGLPTLHNSWQPDLLLRERIEDVTAPSLARFNIRWVIAADRSPTLGDPATERVLGSFHIRELASWDGRFARVESGTGEVVVTELDDDAVEVVVHADQPVLVALGTGYYPRWRATHQERGELPVYAHRTHPTAKLSVVAAWLPPGVTRFTCDGALPSDGAGRWLARFAIAAMIGGGLVWSRRAWRVRALRRIARWRSAIGDRARRVARWVVPAVLAVLWLRGCVDQSGPVRALELGSGLRGNVTVEARLIGGGWQRCNYHALIAAYRCDGLVTAYDGVTSLLNDAPPSWAFNTAGWFARAEVAGVEMRVRLREQLAGSYWIATTGGQVVLDVSEEPTRVMAGPHDRAIIKYGDRGVRTIEVIVDVSTTVSEFTFVREDTIIPDRTFMVRPPSAPVWDTGGQ